MYCCGACLLCMFAHCGSENLIQDVPVMQYYFLCPYVVDFGSVYVLYLLHIASWLSFL